MRRRGWHLTGPHRKPRAVAEADDAVAFQLAAANFAAVVSADIEPAPSVPCCRQGWLR